MNILLQGSTRSDDVHFSLCSKLYEEYPSANFGYFSDSIKALDLFKDSINPKFKTFKPYHYDQKFDHECNMNLIRDFEESTGANIWKIIYADRRIGWTDNLSKYGTFIQKNKRMNQKYLASEVANYIRGMSEMFIIFKPDIFIPAKAMGGIDVFIFEALCKKSGVEYLLPDYSRVSNLYTIFENVISLSPEIDKDFYKLMKESEIDNFKNGQKLFEDLTVGSNKSASFDKQYMKTYDLQEINNIFGSLSLIIKIFFEMNIDVVNFIKQCIRSLNNSNLKLSMIFYKLKISIFLRYLKYSNHKTVLSKSFGQLPNDNQKYLYFPLYNIPEYSSNFQSTMWLDIVSIVNTLSISIPFDWTIVLKEHPTSLNFNFRDKNFYSKIAKIPNVIFAPVWSDSNKLISNAELVFVTVGTSGWEAILKGVPVLSPVANFWDCMKLSRKSSDLENLYEDIKKTVYDNNQLNKSERDKRLITFLEALSNNSFPISNPEVFSYYHEGTKDQYSEQGIELSKGLIAYMKKINIDKSIGDKVFFQSDYLRLRTT